MIPYNQLVSEGKVPRSCVITKYGNCNGATIGTTFKDVWSRVGTTADIPFPTTATVASIVSGSTQDSIAGTGTYQILIEGLDENQEPQQEIISLTGTTPVVTTSLWWRIWRMQAYTKGSTNTTIKNGVITATVNSLIVAEIPLDGTTTFMACYTIPANTSGLMKSFRISVGNKEAAWVELVTRRSPTAPWVVRTTIIVSDNAIISMPVHPAKFNAGTDIRWRAKQFGVAAVNPHVTFQLECIDD